VSQVRGVRLFRGVRGVYGRFTASIFCRFLGGFAVCLVAGLSVGGCCRVAGSSVRACTGRVWLRVWFVFG
jgi:hypothetical protein